MIHFDVWQNPTQYYNYSSIKNKLKNTNHGKSLASGVWAPMVPILVHISGDGNVNLFRIIFQEKY